MGLAVEGGHWPPLKVTVAPNGARRQPSDHPALPVTTDQIADCAASCQAAGADQIHLHVREDDGRHSLDAGRYRDAMAAIADTAPGLEVQITTEAAGLYDVPSQLSLLQDLRPGAASIAVREIMRRPDLAQQVYATCAEAGTQVQHILYNADDLAALRHLLDRGTVPDHMRAVLLVFGRYDPPQIGQPGQVGAAHDALSGDFPDWTICAFGPREHEVAEAAMRLGAHVRIGFENNLQRPDGSPARDNAENIARAVRAARSIGRRLLNDKGAL